MHLDTLVQKKLFEKRVFELNEMGVKTSEEGGQNNSESTVDYDQIGFKVTKLFGPKWRPFWIRIGITATVFALWVVLAESKYDKIFVVSFFGAVVVASVLIGYLNRKKHQSILRVEGGSITINFWLDKPSRQEVEKFVEKLHENTREFYKKKYGSIDPHLSSERQVNNFLYLRDMGVISQDEYENLCKKLDTNLKPVGIGFKE